MTDSGEIPAQLRYTKDHEWVRMEGDTAVVGITHHAQDAMGDITYVEMPEIGREVAQGDELAAVESAKAASDIYAPVGGAVAEVNKALDDAPEKINQDPYGEGWICKLSGAATADLDRLLDAAQYEALCREGSD